MWDKKTCNQVGSLVLGTGTAQEGQSEAEKRKYAKIWQIKIDKLTRYKEDRHEAEEKISITEQMDYDTMFMKGHNNEIQQ